MGANSKIGGSLFNSLSYYHQHHHFPRPGPDGMPEDEWCDEYAVAKGAGCGCGSTWIFFIFLLLILLLFI
jgi:hypothetical protein